MGSPFTIAKTYSTEAQMIADYDNMQVGDYVMIDGDIELQENATLWVKEETPAPTTKWHYLADFSGASGIQGETGATPNIQIGTVTSGETPSVTRSGTNENPILNFVLQKGDTGSQGPTGPTGNGISSISILTQTSSSTTYRINYTNGTYYDYEVTNGEVTQAQLDEVIAENNYLNSIIDQIVPKVTGSGEYITLNDTIEAKMDIDLYAKLLSQDGTPTPSTPYPIHTISGSNTLKVEGKNLLKITSSSYINNGTYVSGVNTNEYKLLCTASDIYVNEVKAVGRDYEKSVCGNLIPCNYGETIYFDTGNNLFTKNYFNEFDENLVSLGIYNKAMSSGSYTPTNANCRYVTLRFGYGSSAVPGTTYTLAPIISRSAITDYKPYTSQEANIDLPVENLLNVAQAQIGKAWNNGDSTARAIIITPVKPNTTYSISYKDKSGVDGLYYFGRANSTDSTTTMQISEITTNPKIITTTNDTNYLGIQINKANVTQANINYLYLQIEPGTKANAYTPYGTTPIEYCKIGDYEDVFMKPSGANLWKSDWEQGTVDAVTGEKVTSTTSICAKDFISVTPLKHYAIKRSITGAYVNVRCYDINKNYLGTGANYINIIQGSTAGNPMQTNDNSCIIQPKENVYYIKWNDFTNNLATEYMMIEGDTIPTYYEPYDTTQWYLKKNIGKVVLDGSETYTQIWFKSTNATNGFRTTISNILVATSTSEDGNLMSNYFISTTQNTAYNNSGRICRRANNSEIIINFDENIANTSDLSTWLGTHNTEVYYPLSTPTYTPITGTLSNQLDNIKSKLLSQKGQTNISQVNNDLPFEISVSALGELNV